MKYLLLIFVILPILGLWTWKTITGNANMTGAPPYLVDDQPPGEEQMNGYAYLNNWSRPAGPAKVALQAGHWKNDEVPEELEGLRGNTGSTGGDKAEWEVNYDIASRTASILQEQGIQVEILATTVPPKYWADVFVSIHADGSTDSRVSGFKAAAPRRDLTGKTQGLLGHITKAYQASTKLTLDPNVSRNMRGYYAFAWWRYEHAVHPMTSAIILETGFLTNPSDRNVIVKNPQLAAVGIADGISAYLESIGLVENTQPTE